MPNEEDLLPVEHEWPGMLRHTPQNPTRGARHRDSEHNGRRRKLSGRSRPWSSTNQSNALDESFLLTSSSESTSSATRFTPQEGSRGAESEYGDLDQHAKESGPIEPVLLTPNATRSHIKQTRPVSSPKARILQLLDHTKRAAIEALDRDEWDAEIVRVVLADILATTDELESVALRLPDDHREAAAQSVTLPLEMLDLTGDASGILEDLGPSARPASPSSTHNSDTIEPALQDYYDSAGWVGILQERLLDLQYDHYEATEKKRLDSTLPSLLETQSERDFSQAEDELKQQLRDARRTVTQRLERCKEQGIDVEYRLQTSLADSAESGVPCSRHLSPQQSPLQFPESPATGASPLDVAYGIPSFRLLESHNVDALEIEEYDPPPSGLPKVSIRQWITDVVQKVAPSEPYQTGTMPDNVRTRSSTSLPDYIIVDNKASDAVLGSDTLSAPERVLKSPVDTKHSPNWRPAYPHRSHSDSSVWSLTVAERLFNAQWSDPRRRRTVDNLYVSRPGPENSGSAFQPP